MQSVPSTVEDFVAQGNDAMRRKDWPEAVRIWALMREKFPDHLRGYVGGATAMKECKEFSDADALVVEGLEKFPQEAGLYIEYGDIAVRQKNWVEAAERWGLMREKCPDRPTGYTRGAAALKEQGDFAAAEALVLAGLEKFPEEVWLYNEYGEIAMRRKDWSEAARRWALMREKCPDRPNGYSRGGIALKELGEFAAADVVVLEGLEKFPKWEWLHIVYGDIAMHQKNWPEAARRWSLMREKLPDHPRGYQSGAAVLKEQGDYAAANAVVLEALEKFPKEAGLYAEYGDIAMRQRDWSEAVNRWSLMREKCPDRPTGYTRGAAALKEDGDFAGAETVVVAGLEKFPEEFWLYNEYGDIAMRQRNWPEAAQRWALMRKKFPDRPVRRDYEFYRICPPEWYPEELKLWFKARTGAELNLENPQTFNEKIQWLKLYDSTPEKTKLADKYLVREYIKDEIGEEYLIPLLGVWDNFDDIDFDALPDSFVLKANHGSGWNAIVQNKASFDREAAKYNFDYLMNKNFALVAGFELHYTDIIPKIIGEQYIENMDKDLHDYKVFCFNGKPYTIVYMQDRTIHVQRAIFDLNWNKLSYSNTIGNIIEHEIPKPEKLDIMLYIAEKLATPFAFVRIDFYVLNNSELKFGEMTFTPASGTYKWQPEEQNLIYGKMLTLPDKKLPLPTKSFEERGVQPLPENFRRRETDIRKKA